MTWLADEVGILPTKVVAAAAHVGNLLEAVAFMKAHPKGTTEHAVLASRLQLGDTSAESILACIKRAAPEYRSICEAADAELDELLADLKGMFASC